MIASREDKERRIVDSIACGNHIRLLSVLMQLERAEIGRLLTSTRYYYFSPMQLAVIREDRISSFLMQCMLSRSQGRCVL